MTYLQYDNWVPGAVLRVYSQRRGVWHFGIASSINGMVYHGSKDRELFAHTSYAEFTENQPTEYAWFPETWEKTGRVLSGAVRLVGQPFNLLTANCEDYVNFIVTRVPRSPQRETIVLLGVLALAFGLLAASRGR